ncbi:MAG: ATP-dependent DNA helicase RecG [Candidatus Omnitrophica bacterium]|nr:ATP-dependent DNA helicase RecG [Candidatus Omnitrophota bacterium]
MQAKKSGKDIPIRYIKGVGPRKAELFEKLGVGTVSDLFYYLPRRYEDRSAIVPISGLKPGDTAAVIGKVLKVNSFRARTGTLITEVALGGDSRRVFGVWYNLPYIAGNFKPGRKAMFYGKVELQSRLQISHPAYEIIEGEGAGRSLDMGRIVPVYSLTEKLSQRYMRKVVDSALSGYLSEEPDLIPTPVRARRHLVDTKFAVQNIHFPYSFENLEKAYRRLVFEEFFILQVIMALKRSGQSKKGIRHEVEEGLMEKFRELFPFTLTAEQEKCIRDIRNDMASGNPMRRLVQGDVGSGKTVVAMYALLLAVSNGYQGVMMAPTEILARQHYVTVSKFFMPLGLNVRLLVSGMDRRDAERISGEISSGDADIVIGTHSLIQEGVGFRRLGLAVIDEQHKFGVEQRKLLRAKGSEPDTLFMTATPIPRSLALTVYGDMDLSMLREKPSGRSEVTTYCVAEDKRRAVYTFIREELDSGRQAFIVYPRVKATSSSELKAAEDMYERLREKEFAGYRVAMVHGRMKPADKDGIMRRFREKKIDLLIATTVIEVGVDIPNVTVLLVEHAERYGLSQLHQLRGRIGRGKYPSYCILMGSAGTEAAEERLRTMADTHDGFEIAEKDLDIRGPGEFLGTRQSGLPELRFGNILKDFSIMEEARDEAFRLVEEDPALKDEHHILIKQAISSRFRGKLKVKDE